MFPFSSWAAYFGAIFFAQESVQALGAKTWMGAYIKAIPFCIYPIVALLIVILFSAGVFPKLGGMKKAYERVAATGKVYSDASKKYNMDDGEGEQPRHRIIISLATADSLRSQSPHAPIVNDAASANDTGFKPLTAGATAIQSQSP